MKTQKSILSLALIAGLAISLIACGEKKLDGHAEGSEEHDHEAMSETMENMDQEMTMAGAASKTELINEYLEIKQALSANNKVDAAKAAAKLAENAKTISFDQVSTDDKTTVNEILEVIQEHSEHIAKSEMDHQIEHFQEYTYKKIGTIFQKNKEIQELNDKIYGLTLELRMYDSKPGKFQGGFFNF